MQYRRDPDLDLVSRCQSSRSPAEECAPLDQLLRRYQERVARWCLRVLHDRDDAADCAQEVLWRISRGVHGFRGTSSFASWVYSLTVKACASALERRRRLQAFETFPIEWPEGAGGSAPSTLDAIAHEEATSTFRRLVETRLSRTEADVLELHHVDGMPVRAISRLLGLGNASGARAFLASAKRKLVRTLTPRRLEEIGFHPTSPAARATTERSADADGSRP